MFVCLVVFFSQLNLHIIAGQFVSNLVKDVLSIFIHILTRQTFSFAHFANHQGRGLSRNFKPNRQKEKKLDELFRDTIYNLSKTKKNLLPI